MRKLDIVITMGGLGSRFRRAGYDMPKYRIRAGGRTLFEWSLASLEGFRDAAGRYIFIAAQDREYDAAAFIREQCRRMDIENYELILIDYLTGGQAETAVLAQSCWDRDAGLLIYNIDTYVEAGQMNSAQLCGDGFIPCFRAEGSRWSFVRLDASGKAAEIKEKERISENCTVGAYYFRTCGLYQQLYEEYYAAGAGLVNGEKYVAPLYNCLIEKGGAVYTADIPAEKVHVLGTPEELDVFRKELPFLRQEHEGKFGG